jgi:hypothetical protein
LVSLKLYNTPKQSGYHLTSFSIACLALSRLVYILGKRKKEIEKIRLPNSQNFKKTLTLQTFIQSKSNLALKL